MIIGCAIQLTRCTGECNTWYSVTRLENGHIIGSFCSKSCMSSESLQKVLSTWILIHIALTFVEIKTAPLCLSGITNSCPCSVICHNCSRGMMIINGGSKGNSSCLSSPVEEEEDDDAESLKLSTLDWIQWNYQIPALQLTSIVNQ